MSIALPLHHVGVACRSIEGEMDALAPLGYVAEGGVFEDPIQGVRGVFVTAHSSRLELLEPLSSTSGVLTPWLASGTKLYHLAYGVDGLEEGIARLRAQGAKLVVAPVPAVAFGGRRIAFLMLRNRLLVELIEQESP